MKEEKKEEKIEETVPRGGIFITKDVQKANELIASGQWYEKQINSFGEIFLKRLR